MATSSPLLSRAALLAAFACSVALPSSVLAEATDVTAVYASTGNGYHRQRQADGTFQPETYAFAEGGRWDGTVVDRSLDDLSFMKVVQAVAAPLRRQNFVPATRARDTQLMILVFWGTTTGAESGRYAQGKEGVGAGIRQVQDLGFLRAGYLDTLAITQLPEGTPAASGDPHVAMELAAVDELGQSLLMNQAGNAMRDRNNAHNAAILGFWEEYDRAMDLPTFSFARTVIDELEADRYFVVLKAYDFQTLRKEKRKVLLWETRFSVRQRNNRFDALLPVMAQTASKYFGQDSGRLLREVVPVGRVDIGEPTLVQTRAK